jgi:DNA-binding CsgD family transcriptional regulator
MNPLSQNDLRALSAALEKIYSVTSPAEFPACALSAVKHLFSCNTICYNEVILPDSMSVWVTEPVNALPGPVLRETFGRHLTEHPALAHFAATGEVGSFRISDFVSQRQFHNLELYNEYYRPSGVEYQLLASIMIAPDQMVGVALDRDSSDFTDEERLTIDLLRPHLVQAYRNVQMLDLMRRASENGRFRMLVIGRSGKVHLSSDDTWRALARFFTIPCTVGVLPDTLSRWVAAERARLALDDDSAAPSLPFTVIGRHGKLTVRFIWGGRVASQDLLLLEEETVGLDCGLTRRESEILSWLSQGRSNEEIGLALSISTRTVKKHLENIYRKLNVHRRTAAVMQSYNL